MQLYPYTQPTVSNTEMAIQSAWTGDSLPQWSRWVISIMTGSMSLLYLIDQGDSWRLIFSWENDDEWIAKPELALKMPHSVSIFCFVRDYNQDGVADIFTHTTGGIRLYRGLMRGLILSFSVESNLIEYNTGFGNSNIYNRSIDIPRYRRYGW